VADALYGMSRGLLSQVRRLGRQAVVAVREGVWRGVKSQERQWAQRLWQEHRDI
jgi:threonine aldolase